jgi:hypothetical protein
MLKDTLQIERHLAGIARFGSDLTLSARLELPAHLRGKGVKIDGISRINLGFGAVDRSFENISLKLRIGQFELHDRKL